MKSINSRKILFVHHGKVMGGAPTSLKNMIIGLEKNGFNNIKVLCSFPDMKSFFQDGTNVKPGDIFSPFLSFGRVMVGYAKLTNLFTVKSFISEILFMPFIIYRQYKQLKEEKPDIIHLNSSILFPSAITAKIAKIPLVWHVREVLLGSKFNPRKILAGWLIRKLADSVICISEVGAKSLGQDKYKNVHIIYNFIDFSIFNTSNINIEKIKSEYQIKNDEKVIISLGGVSFRKGTLEIIETARKMNDIKFLIAGTYPRKHDYNSQKKRLIILIHKVEDLLVKIKLKDIYSWLYSQRIKIVFSENRINNVKFVGKLTNVVPLIAISDALIFAGCTPHFPRPVYEAWALKKPVIVFNMKGVSGHIDNYYDGIVTKKNEVDELVKSIRFIVDDEGKAEKMGENGYMKAKNKFNMDSNIRENIEVYKRVLNV